MPTTKKIDVLIIGAGPTGIGAAIQLERNKQNWHLVEATPTFGGLAGSFTDTQGFTWDMGGHVAFSHYEEFDRQMDAALAPDEWLTHTRSSAIWMNQKWIPYPLQYNLHHLPVAQQRNILEEFSLAAKKQNTNLPNNYDEWISQKLGPTFNNIFLRPYSKKVWSHPNTELGYTWVDERVALPRLEDVSKSIETRQDSTTWGPNHTFIYPKQGGTGKIWERIGKKLPQSRIQFNTRVQRIDALKHIATTDDGTIFEYQKLISSLPIDRLFHVANIDSLKDLSKKFLRSPVTAVGIGLMGEPSETIKKLLWAYFPESTSPYYRINILSNFSQNNVPRPEEQWSLLAEISGTSRPEKKMVQETINALVRDQLINDPKKIISTTTKHTEYGYPVPFLGRDELLQTANNELEKQGIFSRGRFGAWKYEVSNQDHSFMQGLEVVEKILHNKEEQTINFPSKINARRDNPFPYPEWK